MATASVTVPGAVGVIHCPLPATVEDAISAAHKMQPGCGDNTLLSQGAQQLKPGDALEAASYTLVSYDALGKRAIKIPQTECRGIILPQLQLILGFIKDHAHLWVETYSGSPDFEQPLDAETFNLYHTCTWIITPATLRFTCSLVELLATDAEAQYPLWFVSHAWQEAVCRFVACLREHANLRHAADSAYWICAYANNQHNLKEEIALNPRGTSFYKAMKLSLGVVLILDKDATPFTRIWCCFEESIAVEERNTGMPLLLDVAATDSSNEAHVITDGLAAAEARQMPLLGFLTKSLREANFPTGLARKGLDIDISRANASQADDKIRILNCIRLPHARTQELADVAPLQDPTYSVVNQALAAHFALASWFGFVAQGDDTRDLLRALAADNSRQMVELSFTGCRGFTDDSLQQLLNHLPRQLRVLRLDLCFTEVESWDFLEEMPPLEELTLRFTGSRLADVSGLARMLDTEGLAQSLRSLHLWFTNLPSLVELGSWEPLTKLQLDELVLQLKCCGQVPPEAKQSLYDCAKRLRRSQRGLDFRLMIEGVAELSWSQSWWQSWSGCQPQAIQEVELAGSKTVDHVDDDLDGCGSDCGRAPFPCSHSSCNAFHHSLHGFCHKHRLRRHCWKLASCCWTAWHWTELSLLFAMQAAAEIEHPTALAAILLSLYPVACLSLEESLGVSWAVTSTLLAVAVLCSLVTTSARLDQMRVQALNLCLATEASYSQVLQLPNVLQVSTLPSVPSLPTMGYGFADPRDLRQRSTDLSEIFLGAQRHLPLLQEAMNLALPDATVKLKLLTSLSEEERQSPEKVVDALRCELICENMLGVQESFNGLKDRIHSEETSWRIAAVRDTFAEISEVSKCCQVVLEVENYYASVFLMDLTLTRLENQRSDVTKLAEHFGLLDEVNSKWETSLRLRNYVPDVRRPLIIAGTTFLQIVSLVVSLFMAAQYFLRYAHRIRSHLPGFLLDVFLLDMEESRETVLQAAFLALPYMVLVAVFLLQLLRWKISKKRPQPTQMFYERYFGLRGTYYPVKVAVLQASTVVVQAFGKISLMSGLVTFAQHQADASTTRLLAVGFWMFFVLLCWNSMYPLVLLVFPETAWARIGAALTDAVLDLGYILTYLGMVLVAMLRLQTASDAWGNFGEDLTLSFSNRISPVFAFPTDILGYAAVYINLAHACCIAHVLQRTNWNLPVQSRRQRQKDKCLPRLFGAFLSVGLLVMLTVIIITQEGFPMTHGKNMKCFPCQCSTSAGPVSGGLRVQSCSLAAVLRQTQVNLAGKNITSIHPKALSSLGCRVQRLSLSNNTLIHLPPNLFEGLGCLEELDLTRTLLHELHDDAFRGLEKLKLLTMSENELSHLSAVVMQQLPLLEQLLLGSKIDINIKIKSKTVIVTGNRIRELGTIFGHNPELQVIDFTNNRLEQIDPETFTGLHKLRTLRLGGNKLSTIPAVKGLAQLQTLDLQKNAIRSVPADAFQGLAQLKTLNLESTKISSIPTDAFQGLAELQTLNWASNKISSVPKDLFQGLAQLQTLDLDNNHISSIATDAFKGLAELKTLQLNLNWISSIGANAFQGMTQLHTLGLWGNKISSIATDGFQGLAQLQTLDLSSNKISSIPRDAFQGLVQLQTLDLAENKISSVPKHAFQHLVQLQTLDLAENKISSVPKHAFQGLAQLQMLDLGDNQISSIPTDLFQGLARLETLNLRGNKISSNATDAFQGLVQLETLDLASNEISSITKHAFQGLVRLETLELSYNKISNVSTDVFKGLVQLQTLNLASNKISSVPRHAFEGLARLQTLKLRGNKISSIATDAFQGVVQLEALDLARNEVRSVPSDAFQGLAQLKTLNLESTKISSIPTDAFQSLAQLETLHLSGNEISSIATDAFQGLARLETLELSWNEVSSIATDAFQGLSQLQTLHLSSNRISSIPADAFQGLAHLQTLRLRDNKISSIATDAFQGLVQLKSLNLNWNKISSIATDAFQGLARLETLELRWNEISSIPTDAFQGLSQLQTLELSSNRISSITADAFQGLEQLKKLYLSGNQISSVPTDAFQGLAHLQTLWLRDNKISSIATDAFQGLVQLETLDLRWNKISSIPTDAFQGLAWLVVLDLRQNPWNWSKVSCISASLPSLEVLSGELTLCDNV